MHSVPNLLSRATFDLAPHTLRSCSRDLPTTHQSEMIFGTGAIIPLDEPVSTYRLPEDQFVLS
jgi:hypothetical protein